MVVESNKWPCQSCNIETAYIQAQIDVAEFALDSLRGVRRLVQDGDSTIADLDEYFSERLAILREQMAEVESRVGHAGIGGSDTSGD